MTKDFYSLDLRIMNLNTVIKNDAAQERNEQHIDDGTNLSPAWQHWQARYALLRKETFLWIIESLGKSHLLL
jgi:hypothetical protein